MNRGDGVAGDEGVVGWEGEVARCVGVDERVELEDCGGYAVGYQSFGCCPDAETSGGLRVRYGQYTIEEQRWRWSLAWRVPGGLCSTEARESVDLHDQGIRLRILLLDC